MVYSPGCRTVLSLSLVARMRVTVMDFVEDFPARNHDRAKLGLATMTSAAVRIRANLITRLFMYPFPLLLTSVTAIQLLHTVSRVPFGSPVRTHASAHVRRKLRRAPIEEADRDLLEGRGCGKLAGVSRSGLEGDGKPVSVMPS